MSKIRGSHKAQNVEVVRAGPPEDPNKYWEERGRQEAARRRDLLAKQQEGRRVVADDDETAK